LKSFPESNVNPAAEPEDAAACRIETWRHSASKRRDVLSLLPGNASDIK